MLVRPRTSTNGASGSRTRSIPGCAIDRYLSSDPIATPKPITARSSRSLAPVVLGEPLRGLLALLGAPPRAGLRVGLAGAVAPVEVVAEAGHLAQAVVGAVGGRPV